MIKTFQKATPIFAKEQVGKLNSSLFIPLLISAKETRICIAAHNFYRFYVDGNFYAYGPSRGAHDHYRVDEIYMDRKEHHLVIELSAAHCNSFYAINRPGFVCFETLDEQGRVVQHSSLDTKVYLNGSRRQVVTRFSYQRAFAENLMIDPSFNEFLLGKANPYPLLTTINVDVPCFEERIVEYPTYAKEAFSFIETGKAAIDPSLPSYQDRYQSEEILKIYPRETWEYDSNEVASKLTYSLESKEERKTLSEGKFSTYSLERVLTGFFDLSVHVGKPSTLYLLFDEIDIRDPKNPDVIGLSFYRNTTHNCVTYELQPGDYRLTSFEPYAAKFLRLVVTEGEIEFKSIDFIRYENPGIARFSYSFANKKIESVFDAAVNTFAQNAVDLLTDCPSRERAGWLCDSFFSGQAEPFLVGNNLNEQAFLDNYASCSKEYLPDGMIPMCYPADSPTGMFIPNWSLWYILELVNYQNRHGRDFILEKSLDNVRGILRYFKGFENEDGLLENLENWVFVEWSNANDPDFLSGVNAPSNMLYAEALDKAAILLNDPSLKDKAEHIRSFIRGFFFNGEFFVDNAIRNEEGKLVLTDHTTETCQYYAFYFHVADLENYGTLFETMRLNFGQYRDDKNVYPLVYKSNVLMGILMRLTILNRYGYGKQMFDESVDYFASMASLTGTLWENDSPHGSLDHCFTSYIVCLLLEANFGLLYVDLAKKEIHLRRKHLGEDGEVSFYIERQKTKLWAKGGNVSIEIPHGYIVVYSD